MDDRSAMQIVFAEFNSRIIMKHYTRFRAYQLGECGASFSFSVNDHFTLIEARYNDVNKEHIKWEMRECCGPVSVMRNSSLTKTGSRSWKPMKKESRQLSSRKAWAICTIRASA